MLHWLKPNQVKFSRASWKQIHELELCQRGFCTALLLDVCFLMCFTNYLGKHVSAICEKKTKQTQKSGLHHLLTVTKSLPQQPAAGSPSLWNLRETTGILVKSLKAGTNINPHPSSGPPGASVSLLEQSYLSEPHPSGLQFNCSRGT